MKALSLHLAVLLALFAAHFALPAYHHGAMARILVLATFAMGYNIAFGIMGGLTPLAAAWLIAISSAVRRVRFGWSTVFRSMTARALLVR